MKVSDELRLEIKNLIRTRLIEAKGYAQIMSATPLSEAEVNDLKQKFPQLKDKHITQHTDPSLLAGFVIKIGSQLIDYSLRSQLNLMRSSISTV